MEDMLRVVGSAKKSEELPLIRDSNSIISTAKSDTHTAESRQITVSTPANALEILKSKPGTSEIVAVLNYLDPVVTTERDFSIVAPGSTAAQILHVLVSTTIPDHWKNLVADDESEESNKRSRTKRKARAALLRCFSSVTGIGIILAQLRKLLSGLSSQGEGGKDAGTRDVIKDLLNVLSSLLKPRGLLLHIQTGISKNAVSPVQRQIISKELASYLAAGKVLSTAAEAFKSIDDPVSSKCSWISEGPAYASWLGGQISVSAMKLQLEETDTWSYLSSFTGRSLSLGYTDHLVGVILSDLFMSEHCHSDKFGSLLDGLKQHEQKKLFEAVIHNLQARFFSQQQDSVVSPENENLSKAIGGVSAVLYAIINERQILKDQLKDWLVSGVGGAVNSILMRRSLLSALAKDSATILEILQKGVDIFGDKLNILHSPIGAQEANVQVILLAAGYVHRSSSTKLSHVVRSGSYLSAISKHLATSSHRSRFLGMVVAMAFSRLVDSPDHVLNFDTSDMESEEAGWYMNLTNINDRIGSIESLNAIENSTRDITLQKQKAERMPKSQSKHNASAAKVVAIEEIAGESEEEDDDLMMFEKPDTDESDSEDDATLVQRSKPSSPVYIRDLLVYLRDTNNADRYHLGVTTAPDLIRRKASFGSELLENAKDLGLVLVSLQDKYNLPKFQELRIQALVALLVAYPLTMGKWAAHTLFDADLSQHQRSSILIAMGLSGRKMAGYREEDEKLLKLPPSTPDTPFPSKRLPVNLENIYAAAPRAIDTISKNLAHKTLQPLALNAADTLTGPNALKIRTFSSRMEVERKRQQREQQRKQNLSKDLYKSLSDGLFMPLINEFGLMLYSTASYSGHNPFMQPHLLSLFVQTITILFSTLGPHTPNLATLTMDTLNLLTTLHNSPVVAEPMVLAAILRLFLAVVDVNTSSGSTAEERLVTEFATQVLELQEWVGGVFESTPKDNEEVRMLAAGIMVKLGEVTERYQGRLLGINSGFAY